MKRAIAALALAGGLAACASEPAKPAATVTPPPPAPPAATAVAAPQPPGPPLEFWAGRTDLIRAPAPPKPAALELPPIQRFKLPNGLEVLVVPRKDLPVASFGIEVAAGGFDEGRDHLGVSDFVAAMLRRGTKKRSADDISRAIDFVGGALDAQASNEGTTATCTVLSKDTPLCLDLLSDILLHPSFPEGEMPEVRDQMLAAVASRYDSPGDLAGAHFDNLLFGENNPEGWVLTAADVQKITRADLETFWKTFYRPNRAILAVAGDVDVPHLRAALEKAFGSWARGEAPARPDFKVPPAEKTRVLLVDKPDLTQATMIVGHPGIRHADPRWYAATLVNYVLGGSDFSSRLMTEVRSKRGLTYGISSSFGASLYQGAFRIGASTKNQSVWEALLATEDELRRMKAGGPTTEELDKAKGYYAGSYPFALQATAGIAAALVAAELHGLGDAYVRDLPLRLAAVDQPAAKAVAAELLHPDTLLIVIVGNGAAVAPQLTNAGIAFERIGFKDPIDAAARAAATVKKTRN